MASEPGDWDPEAVETDIRAEAARLGVGELEPLPSATEVVRQVLSEHYGRPQAGAVVYKALCAMSHGAIYGLLARFREVGPSDTSYARKMAPHLSPTLLREVVRGVVLGHISAVDRAVAYYGCSSPEFWTSWLNKLTSDF